MVLLRRDMYVKNNVVITDVTFTSSSLAANFVTGRSSNGLTIWKTINGDNIKDVIGNINN